MWADSKEGTIQCDAVLVTVDEVTGQQLHSHLLPKRGSSRGRLSCRNVVLLRVRKNENTTAQSQNFSLRGNCPLPEVIGSHSQKRCRELLSRRTMSRVQGENNSVKWWKWFKACTERRKTETSEQWSSFSITFIPPCWSAQDNNLILKWLLLRCFNFSVW